MEEYFNLNINGKAVKLRCNPERTLLWVLRTELGLTGTKYGCGEGYCGSCTVLINNEAVRSCQTTITNVQGKEIITIEGLAQNGDLHPLQKAFMNQDALQCGYCTPGMILNALAMLNRNPNPSRSKIIQEMDNNLCRCGSYNRMVDAIQDAANEMREG